MTTSGLVSDVSIEPDDFVVLVDGDELYQCDLCESPPFTTYKGMQVHRTSHEKRRCAHCGDEYSIRGLDRHERWCETTERSGVDAVMPVGGWLGRVSDFVDFVQEVPDSCLLVMSSEFGPAFVGRQRAAIMVASSSSAVVVLTANDVRSLIVERDRPKRLRRRGRTEQVPEVRAPTRRDDFTLPGLELF